MLELTSILSFWSDIGDAFINLWHSTGIYSLFDGSASWQNIVMVLISFVLVYLAVVKKFEPLLLLPIAFGMFIVNVPGAYRILFGDKGYIITDNLLNQEVLRGDKGEILEALGLTVDQMKDWVYVINPKFINEWNGDFSSLLNEYLVHYPVVIRGVEYAPSTVDFINLKSSTETIIRNQGLFYYIYKGVDWVIFPPIIFLGIGAMTDFGPMIANPKSMLMGAAAQLGVFLAYFGARLLGFTMAEAGAIGIIGGADGPTAIYVTKKLAEDLLPEIAIAAYS